MKVRLEDIRLFDLDSQTVLQISKFVRLSRQRYGSTIRLNDSGVIKRVFKYGLETDDPELKRLLLAIRRSLTQHYEKGSEVSRVMIEESAADHDQAAVA